VGSRNLGSVEVTNADRVVFAEVGVTKGGVVAYYESVADLMFSFMEGRALTVERYPKGTGSKGFMQKNAPDHFGDDLIKRHEVPKEDGGTTIYPVVRGPEAIAAFANLGVITFHVPPSTIRDESHPDWVIWDLDPPPGEFQRVREAALLMREVLEGFQISTALMTSGSNGYHLRATLPADTDARTVSGIARGTSALAAAAYPDKLTLAFRKAERGGRVFVDWLRNAPYSTSVVPWSLRARAGAPVAAPISWDEIDEIDPDGVRLLAVDQRLDRDPWSGLEAQDLTGVAAAVDDALDDAGIQLEPFDRFRS
jgi:bifunctional non-homologous end joining protein LigD